jgi:hypothetical protein
MPITSLVRRLVPAPLRARWKAAAALGGAAALTATLLAGAPSASASTYDPASRCPAGKFCVFQSPDYGGQMATFSTSQPTLGWWDNRISSLVNNTGLYISLLGGTNYDPGTTGSLYVSPYNGEIDLTGSFSVLDNTFSSIRVAHSDFELSYGTQYMDWYRPDLRPSGLPAAARFGDLNGDGRPDLLERAYGGKLWFLPGNDSGHLIGSGWDSMTKLVRHGDYNGDGREDVFARDRSGVLWLYPGNGKGWFGTRVKVGGGWNTMRQLAAVGDLNGDGRRDLVAVDSAGVLWLYPGNGRGWFAPRVKIGGGWSVMNTLLGVGDVTGDGRSDLVARDSSRGLWLYPGNGRGWFGARTKFSASWPSDQQLFATGDITGDGVSDFDRGFPGQSYYYQGTGHGTFSNPIADMPWDDAGYVWAF